MNALAPFRSRKVLDHARGQACSLRFKGCNRDPATTVSCHIRDRHKGMGVKASDCSIVFGCSDCHRYLDEGLWLADMSEADMLRIVLRAMQETLEVLIRDDIIIFPHDKPPAPKPAKPRKPKDLRSKVGPSRPLSAGRPLTSGRKMEGRNDLRRSRS